MKRRELERGQKRPSVSVENIKEEAKKVPTENNRRKEIPCYVILVSRSY